MARVREYRASLVVSAAAASAATTTAITAVLLVQLRKLRPIKWWSVKLWRIHAHAPGSHRVVTLSHSHTQPSNLTFSDRTAGRCGRRDNYFLHHNFSLSLSRSLVAQARRPRTQPTRAEHARVGTRGTGRWAGEYSSMVASQSEWKGKARKLLRGEASTGCQVFSSLSLSLCPSHSPSLSLFTLSLSRRSQTWTPCASRPSSCRAALPLELTTDSGASCCSALHR
jgi:hypothetical protein